MPESMTKSSFLDKMRSERAQWEALLEEIGPLRMELPGPAGEWSVKDIVAHITAYEQWLIEWLDAAARGEFPALSPLNDPDINWRNSVIYEQTRDRPLAEILAESRRVFEEMLKRVEAIPEVDLNDPKKTEWFVKPYWGENQPLWECIAGDSYEHYHQHIPSMRSWLDNLQG